jgi:hypothetical protein
MRNLLRLLGIVLCLLAALPSMAKEDRLQRLVSQAEAAMARNDDQERHRIINEIYEMTTGLDAEQEVNRRSFLTGISK